MWPAGCPALVLSPCLSPTPPSATRSQAPRRSSFLKSAGFIWKSHQLGWQVVAAQVSLRWQGEAPVLGRLSHVSLEDARDRRDRARKLIADGVDRSEHRKAQTSVRADRVANSFEVVAQERFAKFSKARAAAHGDRTIRQFARDILPWIGGRPIAEIAAPELPTVICRIESLGALETANRALANCGQV